MNAEANGRLFGNEGQTDPERNGKGERAFLRGLGYGFRSVARLPVPPHPARRADESFRTPEAALLETILRLLGNDRSDPADSGDGRRRHSIR